MYTPTMTLGGLVCWHVLAFSDMVLNLGIANDGLYFCVSQSHDQIVLCRIQDLALVRRCVCDNVTVIPWGGKSTGLCDIDDVGA
jgi:hypothetical protein